MNSTTPFCLLALGTTTSLCSAQQAPDLHIPSPPLGVSHGSSVVGNPNAVTLEGSSGDAYLYTSASSGAASLFNPAATAGDMIGQSVAISSSRIAVGAPGASYAAIAGPDEVLYYDNLGGRLATLVVGSSAVAGAGFGFSVSLNGDDLLAGAPFETNLFGGAGAAYHMGPGPLTQLLSPTPGTSWNFGFSVAYEGGDLVIGERLNGIAGTASGSAHRFGSAETYIATLRPVPSTSFETFGTAVAAEPGVVVVGTNSNGAYIFSDTTLNGSPYCFGDSPMPPVCPCFAPGQQGHCCANSSFFSGALLSSTGGAITTNDTLVLTVSNSAPNATGLMMQGSMNLPGGATPFSNGLRCVSAHHRWTAQSANSSGVASNGTSTAPFFSTHSAATADTTLLYL